MVRMMRAITSISVRKAGFSLLEILIVMVVVGILATMAMPRLIRKGPSAKWEVVLNELNDLLHFTRQEAIATRKTYRLHFMTKGNVNRVVIEIEKPDPEKLGEKAPTAVPEVTIGHIAEEQARNVCKVMKQQLELVNLKRHLWNGWNGKLPLI